MPCNSDYLASSGQELESKRVCSFIIYLHKCVQRETPSWILKAADEYYGNVNRLDEATGMLCQCCRSLTKEEENKYIYDARNKTARALAAWWERHQEWDARRVREEEETRRRIILKGRALKKLTNEEVEALGLNGNP